MRGHQDDFDRVVAQQKKKTTKKTAFCRGLGPRKTPEQEKEDKMAKTAQHAQIRGQQAEARYAIYTFERQGETALLKWGLHAVADNIESAILHARMLALQPHFTKVQVQKFFEDPQTGAKISKTIKVFDKNERRGVLSGFRRWLGRA